MTNDETRRLAKLAFPAYKGRKFRYEERASYALENYWDGGSREYVKAIRLSDGSVHEPSSAVLNPMNGAAHATFQIPAGVVLVTHTFFCGKDCGLTVIAGASAMLPGGTRHAIKAAS